MAATPQIAIVIPVRNCLELTQGTVETIRTRHPHKIYFIDDHSDRPTKDWLAKFASNKDAVIFTDPHGSSGLAWNWNLGTAAALNDGATHILIANNDILLHPETIDRMVSRIDEADAVLVSGDDVSQRCNDPAELFSYPIPSTIERENPDFSCFMITEETIRKVGWFDEQYIGAYYEDNDYHATITLYGERAIRTGEAPYYHFGSQTRKSHPDSASSMMHNAARNRAYFQAKWGRDPAGSAQEMRDTYFKSPFNNPNMAVSKAELPKARLRYLFERASKEPSDINEHIDLLYRLASSVDSVTELSHGGGVVTTAFAFAQCHSLVIYSDERSPGATRLTAALNLSGQSYTLLPLSETPSSIAPADLLFIDTVHTEDAMKAELERHAANARKYIVFHDTETYGEMGEEAGSRGIWPAISAYMRRHPEWRLLQYCANCNGLTVFTRL